MIQNILIAVGVGCSLTSKSIIWGEWAQYAYWHVSSMKQVS